VSRAPTARASQPIHPRSRPTKAASFHITHPEATALEQREREVERAQNHGCHRRSTQRRESIGIEGDTRCEQRSTDRVRRQDNGVGDSSRREVGDRHDCKYRAEGEVCRQIGRPTDPPEQGRVNRHGQPDGLDPPAAVVSDQSGDGGHGWADRLGADRTAEPSLSIRER
jgi:hypothetical protein